MLPVLVVFPSKGIPALGLERLLDDRRHRWLHSFRSAWPRWGFGACSLTSVLFCAIGYVPAGAGRSQHWPRQSAGRTHSRQTFQQTWNVTKIPSRYISQNNLVLVSTRYIR